MKLFEILDRFSVKEYCYRDAENNAPLSYVAVETPMGGTIRFNDTETLSGRVAIYSQEFLNADVQYIHIVGGNLHIRISDIGKNEHWDKAGEMKKSKDLNGVAKFTKEDDERRKRKQEEEDNADCYCDDGLDE